jgi:hypothetical protein
MVSAKLKSEGEAREEERFGVAVGIVVGVVVARTFGDAAEAERAPIFANLGEGVVGGGGGFDKANEGSTIGRTLCNFGWGPATPPVIFLHNYIIELQ